MNDVVLNSEQRKAINEILYFITSDISCFILRGSAGTGKTTLINKLTSELEIKKYSYELLAPTGRAARILGFKAKSPSRTIHSKIYTLDRIIEMDEVESTNDSGIKFFFPLKNEDPCCQLFIIDESSMIGDTCSTQDVLVFGSGRLLSDLLQYSRLKRENRSGTKILFIGDAVQLPPVFEKFSPALSSSYLKETYDLSSIEFELTEVMRHKAGSAILDLATNIRESVKYKNYNTLNIPSIEGEIFDSTVNQATELIVSNLKKKKDIVLLTYSNAQALDFNRVIRDNLWGNENNHIIEGDILLVTKNSLRHNLYNGDLIKVTSVSSESIDRSIFIRGVTEEIHLSFRHVNIAFKGSERQIIEISCLIMENLLNSRERELTSVELRALFVDFKKRNPTLKKGSSEFKLAISQDEWFNALQVKYGYAMTCHKAQGGEWNTVVVNFESQQSKRTEDFFRWTYTAITRAKSQLFTLNTPRFNEISDIEWQIGNKKNSKNELDSEKVLDNDWDRFSFKSGQEKLFEYYSMLRNKFSNIGIVIERIEHHSYCERYTLIKDQKRATVEFNYKGNFTVSRVHSLNRSDQSEELSQQVLSLMQNILLNNFILETDFLKEFKNRIEKSIINSGVTLLSTQSMPYRYRLQFQFSGNTCQIDFIFNASNKWTKAEEVGGIGSSFGLIEKLNLLLK